MSVTRALAMLLLFSTVARAAPLKVAIVPLHDSNPGLADAAVLEQALLEAVRDTPWIQLANLGGGKLQPFTALKAPHGTQRVLTLEIARLGEGRVAFVQALDGAGSRAVGSTTVSLPGAGPLDGAARARLRAALVKAVDPSRYVGRLNVRVDVPGAEVQLDGRRAQAGTPLEITVGTHALRVTHPQYRDFLRFVDVEFDRAQQLDVGLAAYPLAEGEMIERQRQNAAAAKRRIPWYRSWWALTIAGAALTAVTAGAIYATRPSIAADRTVTFRPSPGP
jgi:hypothetical protein